LIQVKWLRGFGEIKERAEKEGKGQNQEGKKEEDNTGGVGVR